MLSVLGLPELEPPVVEPPGLVVPPEVPVPPLVAPGLAEPEVVEPAAAPACATIRQPEKADPPIPLAARAARSTCTTGG